MLIDETIANIATVAAYAAANPKNRHKPKSDPAVVAAPKWFRDMLHEVYAKANNVTVEELGEVEPIHGALVVKKDDLHEPVLLDADGRVFQILPTWARSKRATEKGLILLAK